MLLEIFPSKYKIEYLQGDPTIPITDDNGFYYDHVVCETMKDYMKRFAKIRTPFVLVKGIRNSKKYNHGFGCPEVFYGLFVKSKDLTRDA
jgi:hypothetical protein